MLYMLLSGEEIDVPAHSGELAAFVARLQRAAFDPAVSESAFIELLYSTENPLLDPTIIKGRGTVTRAVFADPTYHMMVDLLGRKRLQAGTLDLARSDARFTMTVTEAAEKLGLHVSAVRQAILAHRLSSVKRDGKHFLDPAHVAAFKPSPRGRPAPLQVVMGSADGARLSVKHDGAFELERSEGSSRIGSIVGWTRAAVVAGRGEKQRFWRIEPGPDVSQLGLGGVLHVAGRFSIVETDNNAMRAREAFKAFRPMEPVAGERFHVEPHDEHFDVFEMLPDGSVGAQITSCDNDGKMGPPFWQNLRGSAMPSQEEVAAFVRKHRADVARRERIHAHTQAHPMQSGLPSKDGRGSGRGPSRGGGRGPSRGGKG